MCGIAGYVGSARTDAPPQTILERMNASIRHRGPDADGVYADGVASLAHRRLSIIDVAAGRQPMCNETGGLWIVYNGEIFNHAALRADLENLGHRYRTHCDTETVLHAYEQYGPDCLSRFRGMFAFALWDARAKTLFCARDRLGIKPFYYAWNGRVFAFASEIKALFEHPDFSASLHEAALPEYLAFGYGSGQETLFSGIRKLMPGHCLTLSPDKPPEIRRFWDVPRPEPAGGRSDQDWIAECRGRLEETVRMRLMSDVPLGVFLSGGVDSSAIAALMQRMVSSPVKSFSVGYRETPFSELGYARQVAETIGTDHHEIVIGRDEFFDSLPRLIWHEDEPITWPSSVSLYFVSSLAARDVKVVLTGEGSDELFAGYERYGHYLFNRKYGAAYALLPSALRRAVRAGIAESPLLSGNWRRKLGHTFLGRDCSVESLHLDNFYCAFSAAAQKRLFAFDSGALYRNYLDYWDSAAAFPVLDRLLYADQKTYLVELLMKQDQMSMACSLESRVPFLDHPFVEFASRIPAHLKMRGGIAKYILKKAVEGLLPASIVHRKKMGFPTPIRHWLSGEEAAPLLAILRDRGGILAPYLDHAELDRLLDRHTRGLEDATDRIWRLLNFQIWGALFITGRAQRWDAPWVSRAAAVSTL